MSPPKVSLDEQMVPAQHNAIAWLTLTDRELVERSASLGLPAELHPEPGEMNQGVAATKEHIAEAREQADAFAREHAGDAFVDWWIKENR